MAGTNIFISYRRDDSAGYAGRLYDRLAQHFGEAQVFLDVEDVPGATDFTEEIRQALDRSHYVLVVIGPRWLTVTGANGAPRLQDPNDLVRREVQIALDSGVPVVPVLVGGARMPRKEELPRNISRLQTLNAVVISDRKFSADADDLIRTIGHVGNTTVRITPAAEIQPGHWEISKLNYGMGTVTILAELRRDGTLRGRFGGMGGGIGELFNTLLSGPDMQQLGGPLGQMLGQMEYSGRWNYDVPSKLLTLNLMGQMGGMGGGAETWQIRIAGSDRGVYQGIDGALMQYTLKRIG